MYKFMLPKTDAFTAKLVEECKEEFLNSPDGASFREAEERIKAELENLHNQMDAHIYNMMREKFED